MLNTETNTPGMEQRVRLAARAALGTWRRLQTDFEHGQWWITDLDSGRQWSVADAEGENFDFEIVTEGEE